MDELKAEILINGPRGFATATVCVEKDGTIHPAHAEQALATALNQYNELEPIEKQEHSNAVGQ